MIFFRLVINIILLYKFFILHIFFQSLLGNILHKYILKVLNKFYLFDIVRIS